MSNRPPAPVDVKACIDNGPITRTHWLLVLLCFLIVAADGIDVAMMGFIAPPSSRIGTSRGRASGWS